MTHIYEMKTTGAESLARNIPAPVLWTFRGIGQVFFQENALTGALFALGIAASSPLMALGAIVGAAIGTATAWALKFDKSEIHAGIYGFNATLVGIATLFFWQPGVTSISMLLAGCIVATVVTWLARKYLPFPTYTAPFIVTIWLLFFLRWALFRYFGVVNFLPRALPAPPVEPGGAMEGVVGAVAHGVSQVMFQASIGTALLFLAGIAISDWKHASWVLLGSIVGALVAYHQMTHTTAQVRAMVQAATALDPESLVDRTLFENIALGLYGYNATLAAVALFLWRRSVIPPVLGMLLSVPLTELFPLIGLPALTAPFVLATWLVLAFGWLDGRLFRERVAEVP